jgi:outer membrane protein assembly factor BamB
MTIPQTQEPTHQKSLRLWPGVLFVLLQCLTLFVLPRVLPDQGMYWFMGTLIGGLAILLWWAFFSRALWTERVGTMLLMIVALYATSRVLHVSVAQAGMGMLFLFYATPLLIFAFAIAVVASHRFADGVRRAVMVAVILLASGGWALVRTGGIRAAGGLEFAWRWSATPEQQLLAQTRNEPALPAATPAPVPEPAKTPEKSSLATADKKIAAPVPAPTAVETVAEWPGFRGPHRDSVIPGVLIKTDWAASPPVEVWRRPIGPAWSSFAVQGDLLYTQEQRGDDEVVACYSVSTGKPVWMHRDSTRFWEANAGAGPRGTPTLSGGRVYTFGATGILNVLDARSGAVVWSRNAAKDAEAKTPYWGFSSSPLVVGDAVVIAVSGRLVAYDLATGNPRWFGPKGSGSYSSPHLLTIGGVPQIVLLSGSGAISVAPADGAVLWEHKWEGAGAGMLQPALTADGDLLITTSDMGGGVGMRRLAVTREPGGWTVKERWTTRGLKPYFNDFVVHKGHAYGFDGSILACIDLENGNRKWKGGRYGNGQLVLLSEQDVLLVLSEDGELALVAATPGQFTELARFPAIEGKTWNHPVLVGNLLLVRNDHEMAAFRLSLAGARQSSSLAPR